jgi:carbon storage regulator
MVGGPMLTLSRKVGEKITIGDNIVLMIVEVRGDKVRIGIEAPKEIKVMRSELEDKNAN